MRILDAFARVVVQAFSRRNRRVTVAVIAGGATIALANWIAMAQPEGETFLGLGNGVATGALTAPAFGGLVTGIITGVSRRPAHEDGRAGTYAAFAGILLLALAVAMARLFGELPGGASGFERFNLFSTALFLIVIGAANMLVAFPVAFVVMFTLRALMPGNIHKYGWVGDDPDSPGVSYVTPGPPESATRHLSTAYSRFSTSPPRFSSVPRRHAGHDTE